MEGTDSSSVINSWLVDTKRIAVYPVAAISLINRPWSNNSRYPSNKLSDRDEHFIRRANVFSGACCRGSPADRASLDSMSANGICSDQVGQTSRYRPFVPSISHLVNLPNASFCRARVFTVTGCLSDCFDIPLTSIGVAITDTSKRESLDQPVFNFRGPIALWINRSSATRLSSFPVETCQATLFPLSYSPIQKSQDTLPRLSYSPLQKCQETLFRLSYFPIHKCQEMRFRLSYSASQKCQETLFRLSYSPIKINNNICIEMFFYQPSN